MLKILIVEDDRLEQEKVGRILKEKGIDFKIVGNYNDAEKEMSGNVFGKNFLNDQHYKAVITDLNFPRFEGTNPLPFGFCFYGRAKEIAIPCVICTNQNRHDDNGWSDMMASVMGIKINKDIFFNKEWEKAVDSILTKIF